MLLGLGGRHILGKLVRIGLPSVAEPISYQLFQVALAGQVVHLGMLVLGIGSLPAPAAVYIIGLLVALTALILG